MAKKITKETIEMVKIIKSENEIFSKILEKYPDAEEIMNEVTNCFTWYVRDLIKKHPYFAKKYIVAPGAKKWHHCYKHGLVIHSYTLALELAVRKQEQKLNLNADEIAFIGFAHDFCKVNTYFFKEDGSIDYYHKKYKHHGLKSVKICKTLGYKISNKERVCIQLHMSKWCNPEDKKGKEIQNLAKHHAKVIKAVAEADISACTEYAGVKEILEQEL